MVADEGVTGTDLRLTGQLGHVPGHVDGQLVRPSHGRQVAIT